MMEREKIPGTIRVWPGIAEELLGGKAQFVKAGVFKDVDVVLFSHVSSGFGVELGRRRRHGRRLGGIHLRRRQRACRRARRGAGGALSTRWN